MILIRSRSQRTVAFIQTPKRSTIVKKSIGKCYHDISEFARVGGEMDQVQSSDGKKFQHAAN
jgi:hypothetical protein